MSAADMSTRPGQESGLGGPTGLQESDVRRRGPVGRALAARPWASDVLWSVVVLLVGGLGTLAMRSTVRGSTALGLFDPSSSPLHTMTVAWLAGSVVTSSLLLVRRSRPLLVAGALTMAGVVSLGFAGVLGVVGLGLACALYSVASQRTSRTAWAAAVASFLVLGAACWWWERIGVAEMLLWMEPATAEEDYVPAAFLAAPPFSGGRRSVSLLVLLVLLGLGMATGSVARARRLHAAGLLERYRAVVRERDSSAALARAAERARIAREMHDVVAHSLSVMVALSDGAGAAMDRAPDRSREALRELSATGRSALLGMQDVLQALDPRGGEAAAAGRLADPVDADLRVVLDRFRAVGMSVAESGLELVAALETATGLAVVRIVTEALTNVLRHAPGAVAVDVIIRQLDDALEVEVRDDGGRLPSLGGGTGRGLIGMRERADLIGGSLTAGPRPEGGWCVRLLLPVSRDGSGIDT